MNQTRQNDFQDRVARGGDGAAAEDLARAFRAGDAAAVEGLAALWLHAAAAAPERLADIYDGSAAGWLGARPKAAPITAPAISPAEIPEAFWTSFWALALDQEVGKDAGTVTLQTAALTSQVGEDQPARVAAAALLYPGVAEAAAQGYPERFTLAALAACPPGSLGAEFHHLIVSNGFDLEVLDRDALGLDLLPAPLGYLNARILQCHDLWHITGGYRTTALHEVAISGFQAGQFGHHYSAMFLAVVLGKTAFRQPEAAGLFLDTVLSAWTHGREAPPLLGADWPALWSLPTETLRGELGLKAYDSPYPADLFEQLRAA